MARIPQFEEQAQVQGADFSGATPNAPAVNFEAIQQSFSRWQNRETEQRERQVMQEQGDQGALVQEELGTEGIAQAPDVARRYQQAFDERAREVYQERVKLDAQRTAGELRRKHWNDPEGFNRSWGAYQQSQRETTKQQDPVLADQVGRFLESYGLGQYENLAEQQASRERAIQKDEVLRNWKDLQDERQGDLLNDPEETNYWAYLDDLEESVSRQVELGFFSAEEGARIVDDNRLTLTREFVRGSFNERLEAGDIGGAQGIIGSLRQGAWFEDNERDRQLANALERELEPLLRGMERKEQTDVARELEMLRRMNNAARQNLSVAGFDPSQHLEFVMEHGNPNQVEQAFSLIRSADRHQAVSSVVKRASVSQLPQLREAIGQQFPTLRSDDMNSLLSIIETEEQNLSRAVSEGNFLGAAEPFDWRPAMQQLRGAEDPFQVLGQQRAHLEQRRAETLGRLELQDTPDLGLFSNNELADISEQFGDALRRGESDRADDIVTLMGGVYSGDPMGLLDTVNRLDDVGGELASAVLLSQFGQVTDVTDMLALAGEGRNLDKGAIRTHTGATVTDLRDDSTIREAVHGLSMGNATLREELFSMLDNVYLAQMARDGQPGPASRGPARQNIEKMLAPLQDTQQFSNGTRLPQSFLADIPGGARAVRDEINAHLNDPVRFFGRDLPDQQMRFIQPVPLGDGSIGFKHTTENRMMTNDQGEPVRVNAPDIVQQWEDDPGWWRRSMSRLGQAGGAIEEAAQDFQDWRIRSAARAPAQAFGVEPDVMDAVYYAAKRTPKEDAGDRIFEFMLRPSAQDEVDWGSVQDFWRQREGSRVDSQQYRPQVDNRQQMQAAASNLMSQYQARYPDDVDAQLAAYWEGPELVDALKEDFGAQWRGNLPMASQQFIQRAKRRMGMGDPRQEPSWTDMLPEAP